MFKYVSLNIACARATACKVEQQKEHLNPTKLHLHRSPIGRKKNAVGSRKSLREVYPSPRLTQSPGSRPLSAQPGKYTATATPRYRAAADR
jgi:hypothetical protein